MPFDPTLPVANSPNSSAQMRSQLTSLKSLIDAVVSITAAQVDGVTTVNPGDPAGVSVSVIGDTLHFTFAIPRGNDGTQGNPGVTGAQGPPFAQAIVDAVNTLQPGTDATVSASFDGTNVHLTFGIPRGAEGTQGPPGEVTAAQLAAAIVGTSNNTNAVATMDTPFTNDPPTLADIELMRTKYNELVLAARR